MHTGNSISTIIEYKKRSSIIGVNELINISNCQQSVIVHIIISAITYDNNPSFLPYGSSVLIINAFIVIYINTDGLLQASLPSSRRSPTFLRSLR